MPQQFGNRAQVDASPIQIVRLGDRLQACGQARSTVLIYSPSLPCGFETPLSTLSTRRIFSVTLTVYDRPLSPAGPS